MRTRLSSVASVLPWWLWLLVRGRRGRTEARRLRRRNRYLERDLRALQTRMVELEFAERLAVEECKVLKRSLRVHIEQMTGLEARAQANNAIEAARLAFASDAVAMKQQRPTNAVP